MPTNRGPHARGPAPRLSGRRFSVLRDPVHGDVYLSNEELAVLDTPEMQRLRGVRQLGTAYLVFPGAVHTRFDHSIGTLHVTQAIVDAVNLNFELDPRGCLGIGEEEARVLRIAALVHDVTHIPFGHNIEDQTGLFHRHDSPYRYEGMLGRGTALGRLLDELEVREDVLAILLPPGTTERSVPPYWSQILADTICSDILDYLARDAYFTGLKLEVDPRIRSYFKVERASGNLFIDLTKRELLREDILSEIVRMLEARYYFSERVYYHHAKVAAGALVARAVELCLAAGVVDEADFYACTDDSVLSLLSDAAQRAPQDVQARVESLVTRFRHRQLMKRACVFPRYENEDVQEELIERYFARGKGDARRELEARISDMVRFATGQEIEVVVYCPAARMQLKEVHTHVRWPGESDVRPLSEFASKVPRLADLERSYRDLWKFYVFADTSDPEILRVVQRVGIEELAGARSVYAIE